MNAGKTKFMSINPGRTGNIQANDDTIKVKLRKWKILSILVRG